MTETTTTVDPDLCAWPATRLAAAVAAGEVPAAAVLEAHLARIDRVNPQINAVTSRATDDARQAAAAIDTAVARGETVGPLAGVPVTVKESIDVAGLATTHGARAFAARVAARDAPPVDLLRRAGAVVVGHSNMPTLTLSGMHTASELFGSTVNPWDSTVTPGGSSGGDGAAVATGMAALGLGNDSGGSTRLPAQFCGVVGLAPTPGRFPADHRLGDDEPSPAAQLFPVDGPLARTVPDLRAAFEALAVPDPRDPRALPVPVHGPTLPRRVGVVRDPGGHGVDPAVDRAIDHAAGALDRAGYEVVDGDVPMLDQTLAIYSGLLMTEFAQAWPAVRTLLGPDASRYIAYDMDTTPPVDLSEYLRLSALRLSVRRAWAQQTAHTPLLLGPVSTRAAFVPGEESASREGKQNFGHSMALPVCTTTAGVPAVAVPTGLDQGRPVGVQLVGPAFREDLCLDAAAVVESARAPLTPVDPFPTGEGRRS